MTRRAPVVIALFPVALGLTACGDGRRDPRLQDVDAGADAAPEPGDAPPPAPGPCGYQVDLVSGVTYQVSIGPTAVGADGVDICAHLDGTAAERNLFWAVSDQEDGAASSYDLFLFDQDDHLLEEGWDVTYDVENPRTHANLEWEPWGPAVPLEDRLLDVILHVGARTDAGGLTSITLALIDPFE